MGAIPHGVFSKATRQRGPPPQGSTASHKRYDVGGDTPSTCRHRLLLDPAGLYPTKGSVEGVLYVHRGRLRGGRPLPVSGIFGAGKEGLALEPAPPGVTGRYSNRLNYRCAKPRVVGDDGIEPPTLCL